MGKNMTESYTKFIFSKSYFKVNKKISFSFKILTQNLRNSTQNPISYDKDDYDDDDDDERETAAEIINRGLERFGAKQLSDLCADCLYIIFDDLDLMDLINIVQFNETLSPIVAESVRRNYGNYRLQFCRTLRKKQFFITDSQDEPTIQVENFELISTILTHFGRTFHDIQIINPNLNAEDTKLLYKMVNEHCSESLVRLNLGSVEVAAFEKLTKPFENVKQLIFSLRGNQAQNEIRPFNELFPKLHELSLTLYSDLDYSFLDCELPSLEYIPDFGITDLSFRRREQIEGFLRKNPQIRGIHTNFKFPADFAKFLSENLPNVVSLTLDTFDIGNDAVRFGKLKHLVLEEKNVKSIEKLSLPQIQAFEMFYSSNVHGAFEFFRRHVLLSKLVLNWQESDEHGQLDDFAELLPNLTDLQIDFPLDCNAESFSKFSRFHRKLMTFRIRITRSCSRAIIERFKNEFHIEPQRWDTDVHLFTRK